MGSPCIPPVLHTRYKQLRSRAYHLRKGSNPHKTVIRYQGNTLALYARPSKSQTWQLVEPSPYPLCAEYTPVNSAPVTEVAQPSPRPILAEYEPVSEAKENTDQVPKNLMNLTMS